MTQNNEKKSIYNRLKEIINSSCEDGNKLLTSLREQALMTDFQAHDEFENALLELALDTTSRSIRNVLYEILVSLNAVWSEHIPQKKLTDKFWKAYNNKEDDEASRLYSQLTEQGLDYIDTFELGEGKFLPFETDDKSEILHYNNHKIHFLNLDLKITDTLTFPKNKVIIDVLPPIKYSAENRNNMDDKLWILLEENKIARCIIILNPLDKEIENTSIVIPRKLHSFNRLSKFQGYPLIVSDCQIFLYDYKKKLWKEWFREREKRNKRKFMKITCFKPIKGNYWVGLEGGNVRIIRDIEYSGRRYDFEALRSNRINSIDFSEKFVLVTAEDKIVLTDILGYRQLEQKIGGKAIKSIIINDKFIITLTADGMLTCRDIHERKVIGKINLKGLYDTLFISNQKVYCGNKTGNISVLLVPDQIKIFKALEDKNIKVLQKLEIRNPEAPIRHLSEFVGRQTLIDSIKENADSHFLISGGAKVGKTSLLNVLPDLLSSNSVCCYMDMELILMEIDSFEQFEKNFIVKCLAQHALRLEDLDLKSGYPCLKAALEKIRGAKRYCVLCLDNFFLTSNKSLEWNQKFGTFLKDMFRLPQSRMILTCKKNKLEDLKKKFAEIEQNRDISRKMNNYDLGLFTEIEVKDALRIMLRCRQEEIEEIYSWIGNFPHLFQFFKNRTISIRDQAEEMVHNHSKAIFEYFRDISRETNFLITLLFHEELISKNISFETLYDKYPLLRDTMPKTKLIEKLREIGQVFTYTKIEIKDKDSEFMLYMPNNPRLFHEVAIKIPKFRVFIAMNKFKNNPIKENAQEFILSYRKALKIKWEPNEFSTQNQLQDKNSNLYKLEEKYKNDFYIWLITDEARKILKMPLTTFIVIPLKPWIKEESIKDFRGLYDSIQAYLRSPHIKIIEEKIKPRCYILLFELHNGEIETMKEEIKGLDRISVMSPYLMNEILLCEDIVFGTSETIFKQLSISERSPYTTTGAVTELFFGRQLEIALIRGLPENIGIFGTRTIGKTSLLLKLYSEMHEQENWRVFALDCAGIEDEQNLLNQLAQKMEVNIIDIYTLEKFKYFITWKAEKENTQYLFLLDEVDGLVAYDIHNDGRIFQTFNKLCSEPLKRGGVAARFVLFGFQQMYEQMNNPRSRLYNFMVFFPMTALDEPSALKLVTQPMKNIHVKWENENDDANYLVKKCSGYPLLLQSACHTLLTILDKKIENKDIIEKSDIDKVFAQEKFIGYCMRLYNPLIQQSKKSIGLSSGPKKSIAWDDEPFFEDIHKITILTLVIRQKEKGNDTFNLIEIQDELNQKGMDFSPGLVQKIISRLRLNGTLMLIGEPLLITPKENITSKGISEKVKMELKEKEANIIPEKYHVDNPDSYGNATFKLHYKFLINIFPDILIAYFHSEENCKKELKSLIEKKSWQNWKERQEKEG